MSFTHPWINPYNSIMDVTQDAVTGRLSGTYRSTTGGSGTYDVVGWASLADASITEGQPMAISILWRSNDGGKSDPSHEVSGMAGQVVAGNEGQFLSLMHLFVETDPNSGMQLGSYPDKLIFTPTTETDPTRHQQAGDLATPVASVSPAQDNISGTWIATIGAEEIKIILALPDPSQTRVQGNIGYTDGGSYPVAGFTDIFAAGLGLKQQGISISTYTEGANGRACITMAGYLELANNQLKLTRFSAQSTKPGSTWEQVTMETFNFEKAS